MTGYDMLIAELEDRNRECHAQRDEALRKLAVFEEAHAPTDDERVALVSAVDAQSLRMLIDDVDEGAFPDQEEGWFNIVIEEREQLVRRIVEWVQDRDARRPVQAEPTDAAVKAVLSEWYRGMIGGGWTDEHEVRMRSALRAASKAQDELEAGR